MLRQPKGFGCPLVFDELRNLELVIRCLLAIRLKKMELIRRVVAGAGGMDEPSGTGEKLELGMYMTHKRRKNRRNRNVVAHIALFQCTYLAGHKRAYLTVYEDFSGVSIAYRHLLVEGYIFHILTKTRKHKEEGQNRSGSDSRIADQSSPELPEFARTCLGQF